MHLFVFLAVATVALFSFLAVATWSSERRREREAYYRSEAVKKVAESQGAAGTSAIEFLREEEKVGMRRRSEGQKLGGLICLAVGIGIVVFLKAIMGANREPEPAYLIGLIPALIGVALLVYAYLLAPKG